MSFSQQHVETVVTVVFLLFANSIQETINPCSYNVNTVHISALLPIHNEQDCSQIELRGIQQMAALTKEVNELNNDLRSHEGLTLGLQIHDTCSTSDGAVKAALRALVENGQTCPQPPLFLGFIGLEDLSSLMAVKAVTKMFNGTYIIPYLFDNSRLLTGQNVLNVARQNFNTQAKSILDVVSQLNWRVFSLIFEDNLEPLAQAVIQNTKENPSLCLTGTVIKLTQEKINDNIFKEAEENSDGVIVLLDTSEMALRLFQIQNYSNVSLLLSVNKVGLLQQWQVPHSYSNLFILQQTSTSEENIADSMDPDMLEKYNMQEYSKCISTKNSTLCDIYQESNRKLSNSVDASVSILRYAVRLLGSGLKVAHRVRCRKLGEDTATPGLCHRLQTLNIFEWKEFFKRSSSFAKNIDSANSVAINFDMEPMIYYDLYTLNSNNGKLEKIGKVRKSKLINTSGFVFPTRDREIKCSHSLNSQLLMKSTLSQNTYNTTLLDHLDLYKDYSLYQLVGLLCGVGFGMLIVMGIIVFGVYNMFRVKSGKSGKSSSINTPPTVRRYRRGSGSITSNRSV